MFHERLPDVLDLNLTASVVILFVICVRQFLKGAPKIFSYALWGIVLLRFCVILVTLIRLDGSKEEQIISGRAGLSGSGTRYCDRSYSVSMVSMFSMAPPTNRATS